jgi:hypothetical protein
VNVKQLVDRYEELKRQRLPWESLWQDIATYIVPRRYPGMNSTILSPGTEIESALFDTTAIQAHQTAASGCLAWMTPQESAWFAYTPPKTLRDDDARRWMGNASEGGRDTLARSNFYLAAHEYYLDRTGFGTSCIYCEEADDEPTTFQCWPVGTFVISENFRGQVTTVIREFKLTAEQAEEKFGHENLSAKVQKCLDKGGAELLREFVFLHFIMPRKKADREDDGRTLQQRMPIACYYVEYEAKYLCRESGYNEMPVMVSRYLEWGTGTGGCYGWAPAFSALPEARQVNHLQKMMDAMAEKMAFPPVLAPEELEDEIDPNAAGVTWFSQEVATRLPREWMTAGKYDIGKDRVIERQTAINRAFHVDLFQMFASMEKQGQMTAREVAERSAEKLVQFSPTFARLTTEFHNPLLKWLFSTLLSQGAFGPAEAIPASLGIQDAGGIFVLPPTIQYSSRIAVALRQLPSIGFWRTLELCQAISAGKGETSVFDNFDTDAAVRADFLSNGGDADILVPEGQRDETRRARAQAQQQMEEMQQAQMAADAAGKLGGIKPDSMLGQLAA